jgi:catechol 2,3-dioxygenase-like lactoylglutathione lyase family enzyme
MAFSYRTVFFVRDTPSALAFYTHTLGFVVDWTYEHQGRPFVVQVSLFDFAIILNQVEEATAGRAGAGRIFLGVDEEQSAALLLHVRSKGLPMAHTDWGAPTLVIVDRDGNELFFWLPESEHDKWREIGWPAPNR